MTKTAIDDGVIVELPDEWTPVVFGPYGAPDRLLVAAATAYAKKVLGEAYGPWTVPRWAELLCRLWREDVIELAKRSLKPPYPLAAVNYPPSLRHHDNFEITREGLIHELTGRIHFDPHYRLRRPPPPDPVTAPLAPRTPNQHSTRESPPANRQPRPTKVDRAIPLLREAWIKSGCKPCSKDELFNAARELYPDDSRLQLSRSDEFKAARRVLNSGGIK